MKKLVISLIILCAVISGLSQETNYKGFEGDSIKLFLEMVQPVKKQFVKDEFETYEQYYVRLKKLIEETPFGNKTLKDLVFVDKEKNTQYNAEKQELSFSIGLIEIVNPGTQNNLFLTGLEVKDGQIKPPSLDRNNDFVIKMSPEIARVAKNEIGEAVYGFPYYDVTFDRFSLVPTKFVIFNYQTGEIYQTRITEFSTDIYQTKITRNDSNATLQNTEKTISDDEATTIPKRKTKASGSKSSNSRVYLRGPRGGCYYLSGKSKVYVDRSLCQK